MGPVGMEKKREGKIKERFYVAFYKLRDVHQKEPGKSKVLLSRVEFNKKKLAFGRPDFFRIAHWVN